jgi:hypothetical protein
VLAGEKFGNGGAAGEDPVLWMRLITLGVRLAATHSVVPTIFDPDFAAAPKDSFLDSSAGALFRPSGSRRR